MDMHGLGTNELDRKAGVGGGWTSRFLKGEKYRPGPDTIAKVCTALNIREEWLMHGRGPMPADGENEPSIAKIRTTPTVTGFDPDIEATVRLFRNRKTWSLAAQALANVVVKKRPMPPEAIADLLDEMETQAQRVIETAMAPRLPPVRK
jgi:transcriptional regulator with XRE-family HTH domain